MWAKGKKVESVSDLNLLQLSTIKQQLDQEIELLAASIQQLQRARAKYQDSSDCVESQKYINKGSELLVPLSASMYVSGTLVDNDKYLIDIGTGYYVERNRKDTVDYFKRKVAFVTRELERFAQITQEKVNIRESIIEALQCRQQSSFKNSQIPGSSQQP